MIWDESTNLLDVGCEKLGLGRGEEAGTYSPPSESSSSSGWSMREGFLIPARRSASRS